MHPTVNKSAIPMTKPYGSIIVLLLAAAVLAMLVWAMWDAFSDPVEDGLEYLGAHPAPTVTRPASP